jgi:cell division protein FtsB
MDAKTVATWLAILTTLAAGYARFVSLEEAKENHVKWITELSVEQRRLEERISALERDRALLERIHQLELRLGAVEAQKGHR